MGCFWWWGGGWCRNGDFECECGMGEGVSGVGYEDGGLFFGGVVV